MNVNYKSTGEYRIMSFILITLMMVPFFSCTGRSSKLETTMATDDTVTIGDGKLKRIGIIGAGSLGGSVGKLLVKAGYEVMFSSRHPEELQEMASKLGSLASIGTTKH